MAAQDAERKFNICDRCFASVPLGKTNCPECGAPILTEGQKTDQSDSVVYTELARANLLRLRGDYASAEAECLKILRQYPNNASAHTLLGDIYGEKGDFEQAQQWYELSLDLVSDPAVRERLIAMQRRITEREQLDTARELGVPAQKALKAKFILGVLIPVILVFFAAYALGLRARPGKGLATVLAPIQPGPTGVDVKGSDGKAVEVAEGSDLLLLNRVKSTSADGSKVLFVMQDPRTNVVTLCYQSDEDKDIRALGARLALAVLEGTQDALLVNVRAMRGGALIYTADVSRSRVNETKQTAWLSENRENPLAWIEYVLGNEWSSMAKAADGSGKSGVLPSGSGATEARNSNDPGSTDATTTGQSPIQPVSPGGSSHTESGDFPSGKGSAAGSGSGG